MDHKWIINHLGPAAYGRWSDFFFSQRTENRSLQLLAVGTSTATMCNGRYPFNSPPRQKSQKPWVVVVIPCLCLGHINGRKALKLPCCFIEKTGIFAVFCCGLLIPYPIHHAPSSGSLCSDQLHRGSTHGPRPSLRLATVLSEVPIASPGSSKPDGTIGPEIDLSSAKAIHF